MESSVVANWYGGQNILVTGATGFMGKVLVEKVLRSCPDVSTVYVLVRPKRGKEATQRKSEFVNCPAFESLKNSPDSEKIFDKLKCIAGDVCQDNCGLSKEDQDLLNSTVTVVFHVAANVRFDQPMKPSIVTNTLGTLNILEVACNFQKLKVFLHVSTAYCHCQVEVLEEKLYKSPQDPRRMLQLAEWMDEDLLRTLTPMLLRGAPNTYSYTKCLTEQLVSEYAERLPIAIARPSIVTASYKEPMPGWVDNINGPTGIIVAGGKGVLRTMHCDQWVQADVVPVDMVVNGVLLVAWKVGSAPRRPEVEVYNVTANRDDPINWKEALELGKKHMLNYPFSVSLWYPRGGPKSNYYVNVVAAFFLHMVPAYLVDALMTLTGNKPFLVKLQVRLQNGLETIQYYTTREWYFHNDKLTKLYDSLNAKDKEIFFTNREAINYDKYMLDYVMGARKYCVKEKEDTLPHARKLLNRLYYLDLVTNCVLIALFLWALYSFVTTFFI